jgi:fumarate hydratase class II
MGNVDVPNDRYYGAQTARSIDNFPIGVGKYTWDRSIIKALGILKKSAALANADLGQIPSDIAALIVVAADEVIRGKHDDHFPLVIFQTGMYIYSCIFMCTFKHLCIYTFVCIYIHTHILICIYIHVYLYI